MLSSTCSSLGPCCSICWRVGQNQRVLQGVHLLYFFERGFPNLGFHGQHVGTDPLCPARCQHLLGGVQNHQLVAVSADTDALHVVDGRGQAGIGVCIQRRKAGIGDEVGGRSGALSGAAAARSGDAGACSSGFSGASVDASGLGIRRCSCLFFGLGVIFIQTLDIAQLGHIG